jgi:hypothetical protein
MGSKFWNFACSEECKQFLFFMEFWHLWWVFFIFEVIVAGTSSIRVDFLYQLWFNFELHLIAIKLVKEESLVDMLHSYHAVPFVALYFYLKSKDFLL